MTFFIAMTSSSRVESSVPMKFHVPKTFPFQNEYLGQRMSRHFKLNGARMVAKYPWLHYGIDSNHHLSPLYDSSLRR